MSKYQYYEFCNLNNPISATARKEMYSLSRRANVGTHGASFVYNYGNFRGNSKELLLKYFYVFFYISNWGNIKISLKYKLDKLKNYCIKNVISCEYDDEYVLLKIDFNNEDGFGWIEGDGMLPELLPIYSEIKSGNYQFLELLAKFFEIGNASVAWEYSGVALSAAQEAFFKCAELDYNILYK